MEKEDRNFIIIVALNNRSREERKYVSAHSETRQDKIRLFFQTIQKILYISISFHSLFFCQIIFMEIKMNIIYHKPVRRVVDATWQAASCQPTVKAVRLGLISIFDYEFSVCFDFCLVLM